MDFEFLIYMLILNSHGVYMLTLYRCKLGIPKKHK